MVSSQSTIKRYTPPTCTLEILANSSLSRWKRNNSSKDLGFKLSFDDPKVAEEQQVTISGDRIQLDRLMEAVNIYVQQFLHQSNGFSLGLDTPQTEESNQEEQVFIAESRPYLKAKNLLNHQLFLGSLANANSGKKIELNASQLFDLATALDDYKKEIHTFPQLQTQNPLAKLPLPIWAGSAAMLAFTLGITTWGINVANQGQKQKSDITALQQPLPTPSTPTEIVPQLIPESASTPTPSPTLPPALAQQPSITPPSAIPTPPTLPTIAPDSVVIPSLANKKIVQAPTPQINKIVAPPKPSLPPSGEKINRQPEEKKTDVFISPLPEMTNPPETTLPPVGFKPIETVKNNTNVPQLKTKPTVTPQFKQIENNARNNVPITETNLSATNKVEANPIPTPTDTPSIDTQASTSTDTNMPSSFVGRKPEAEKNDDSTSSINESAVTTPSLPQVAPLKPKKTEIAQESNENTSSDTNQSVDKPLNNKIPVQEVKDYFRERWQPPEDLKETLQYRLVLRNNGSLGRIVPVNKAAAKYLDRTNMPLLDRPFVPAFSGAKDPIIRLVLDVDGKVNAFNE